MNEADEIETLIETVRLRALRNGFRIATLMLLEDLVSKDPSQVLKTVEEFASKYGLLQHEQLEAVIEKRLEKQRENK